jgi:hypothetical protein
VAYSPRSQSLIQVVNPMPKKKKKKPQVSAKLQQAQKFNDYKKRLLLIAQACGAEQEFKLLPKREIEFMFFARFKPFGLIAAEGQELSSSNYKIIKQIITYFLKQETITFIDGGAEVNLYDYFYVGNSLSTYINELADEKFKGVDQIIQAFKPLSEKQFALDGPHKGLFEISKLIAGLLSRFNKGYWLFHYHMRNKLESFPEVRSCFKVEYVAPKILHLTEHGNKRPVYRVGWPTVGQKVKWAQLIPQQLNIESRFTELKIDIYIQSHALHRIQERLDTIPEDIHHYLLYQNVANWDALTNSRGQSLIAYTTGETKIGYLVYEYIEGIVLIKTFLLLTNNDTPEGEKLNKLLGLEKTDKQYLDLDKLSHFVKSDIPKNQKLYNQFKDAGCAGLFEVSEELMIQNTHENIHAALIDDYINSAANNTSPTE